jgi:formate-dependent phosphoribosylglycinamide formyltransferase (GAR transformylase)
MKDQIFAILKQSGNLTRKHLHIILKSLGYHTSERNLRHVIEEMIIQDGYSIASSEKGYSIIQNPDQLAEAVAYLNKKAQAIAIRKSCLIKNFVKFKNQLSLFPNEQA